MSGATAASTSFGRGAEAPAWSAPPPVDTAIWKTFHWRSIGPNRGGRSIAVSGVKGQPKVGYFGATGGGLWKTTDGGTNWAPVTDNQITSASVGAVAVSESNPDIVFIGMGESCIRGNIMPGDGVYKSTDAGKTWTHVGFRESDAIAKIRIHPTNRLHNPNENCSINSLSVALMRLHSFHPPDVHLTKPALNMSLGRSMSRRRA